MLPTPPQPPYRSQTRTQGSGHTPLPASMPMPPMPVAGQTTPYGISQQQTMPQPAVSPSGPLFDGDLLPSPSTGMPAKSKRKSLGRMVAIVVLIGLAIAIYLTWHTTISTSPLPTSSAISQQNFGSSSTTTSTTNSVSSSSGTIQVYIVGAVKHPGVYALPSDARVYQVLQAAGGPSSDANLVALNLAAKVSDGEEIYVTKIGEAPPTSYGGVPGTGTGSGTATSSTGQLVNINTASEAHQSASQATSQTQAILLAGRVIWPVQLQKLSLLIPITSTTALCLNAVSGTQRGKLFV